MTGKKILVVDDESAVRHLVSSYLEREGYQVLEADGGIEALRKARDEHPDLIVLDLMLPEIDGLEICRVLRAESDTYILMLTAKTEEADKLLGLGMGPDDYLTKPFSPRELVARVKAILRRGDYDTVANAAVIRSGSMQIDSTRHIAHNNSSALGQPARALDTLKHPADQPGAVL